MMFTTSPKSAAMVSFGVMTPVIFTSYEEVEEQFQADSTALRSKA